MTARIVLSALLVLALNLTAASALAEGPPGEDRFYEPDHSFDLNRLGWYIQINGFYAHNNFDDDLRAATNGFVDATDGAGLNVRGGYQILSWLAVEGLYEYSTRLDADIAGASDRLTVETHNLVGNLKLSLPFYWIQPYIVLGVGAQRSKFNSKIVNPFVSDDRDWQFAGRPGVGIDFVLLEHWTVNFEAAGMLAMNRYKTQLGRDLDGRLFYTSVGGGFRYRF